MVNKQSREAEENVERAKKLLEEADRQRGEARQLEQDIYGSQQKVRSTLRDIGEANRRGSEALRKSTETMAQMSARRKQLDAYPETPVRDTSLVPPLKPTSSSDELNTFFRRSDDTQKALSAYEREIGDHYNNQNALQSLRERMVSDVVKVGIPREEAEVRVDGHIKSMVRIAKEKDNRTKELDK